MCRAGNDSLPGSHLARWNWLPLAGIPGPHAPRLMTSQAPEPREGPRSALAGAVRGSFALCSLAVATSPEAPTGGPGLGSPTQLFFGVQARRPTAPAPVAPWAGGKVGSDELGAPLVLQLHRPTAPPPDSA